MPEEDEKNNPNLNDMITLAEAAQISGLSPSHLRLLVRRGEIWGKKIGRDWLTSEQSVREYLAQVHKPGPKPQKAG